MTISLLKDINSGSGSSYAFRFGDNYQVKLGDQILFYADDDGSYGYELWTTDGTTSGTTLLKDINPGSADGFPQDFYQTGDYVYFSAVDGTSGRELWKTDGTTSGTTFVKDIYPGSSHGSPNDFITLSNGITTVSYTHLTLPTILRV